MKTIRGIVIGSLMAVVGITFGADNAEATVFRKIYGTRSQSSARCKPAGGLFQSRPVSPTSTWSHQHPKWNAGRKATGAAYLK